MLYIIFVHFSGTSERLLLRDISMCLDLLMNNKLYMYLYKLKMSMFTHKNLSYFPIYFPSSPSPFEIHIFHLILDV